MHIHMVCDQFPRALEPGHWDGRIDDAGEAHRIGEPFSDSGDTAGRHVEG